MQSIRIATLLALFMILPTKSVFAGQNAFALFLEISTNLTRANELSDRSWWVTYFQDPDNSYHQDWQDRQSELQSAYYDAFFDRNPYQPGTAPLDANLRLNSIQSRGSAAVSLGWSCVDQIYDNAEDAAIEFELAWAALLDGDCATAAGHLAVGNAELSDAELWLFTMEFNIEEFDEAVQDINDFTWPDPNADD